MVEDVHELMLDHLRHIRGKVDKIAQQQKQAQKDMLDLKQGQVLTREDIAILAGNMVVLENALGGVESDIELIQTRLDIVPGD